MKLEYSRPHNGQGNFGDDLNEWFWERVLPGCLDRDDSTILMGMGTIFDRWFTDQLPRDRLKVVIGSGSGKAGGPPELDETWRVYGVRGPLTAAYSGLPPEAVLTDPAMLVRDMEDLKPAGERSGIGFMPHIWSLDRWDWRTLCEDVGLTFVDPRADSRETIRQIWSLERLLTEAMHGAIVGDALRTPWVALQISPKFEASKWCDWAGSLGLPVHFHSVPDLYSRQPRSFSDGVKAKAKISLSRLGLGHGPRPRSSSWEVREVKRKLASLMRDTPPQLSDAAKLDAALDRTRAALDRLTNDLRSGELQAGRRQLV